MLEVIAGTGSSTRVPHHLGTAPSGQEFRGWNLLEPGVQSFGTSASAADLQARFMTVVGSFYLPVAFQSHSPVLPALYARSFPVLLDESVATLVYSARDIGAAQERFEREVWGSLENNPVEDGYCHPLEQLLQKAFDKNASEASRWIRRLVFHPGRAPVVAASVLRCLGRCPQPADASWRSQLVREALGDRDAEVRDAAIQAAESWGGRQLVEVLRSHQEEEPWLRDYLRRVIRDLV